MVVDCTKRDGTLIADHMTVDFCKHGLGQIALWMEGAHVPFAVAYVDSDAAAELAQAFVRGMTPKGSA